MAKILTFFLKARSSRCIEVHNSDINKRLAYLYLLPLRCVLEKCNSTDLLFSPKTDERHFGISTERYCKINSLQFHHLVATMFKQTLFSKWHHIQYKDK
jgi:hypothetical protein